MARKYILYPIKTIKDWRGEDWDVYEERKTQFGLILNFGWPYGAQRKGSKSLILTMDLVEYLKIATYRQAIQELGLSSTLISRMRRLLELQKKVVRRDRVWIIQHQDEILNYSYPMLQEKYGLSKGVVKYYSNYLVNQLGIIQKHKRIFERYYAIEKIYQMQKVEIAQCRSFKELRTILKTDDYAAKRFHDLACSELNVPAMSEIHLKNLDETWRWRYQHRDTILSPEMSIEQIAKRLNTTKDEIFNARKALRRRLNITEIIGVIREVDIEQWVMTHQVELRNLTSRQLHQQYQLTKGQVKYRRMLLKKLQQKETT